MLGGQRSHVIIERAEEGKPGDEARVWAPGLPGCVSLRRDVGVPVIAIMTVYDVQAAQLFERWRFWPVCAASSAERVAVRARSQAATHDVTEDEVMARGKYWCRCCGRIITDSRERRLFQSDATRGTGASDRAIYWRSHTAAEKRRKKRWCC